MKNISLLAGSLIASIAVLTACAQTTVSVRTTTDQEVSRPVTKAQKQYEPISRDQPYVVQAGDTLYGISFRAGLSYREVAVWNDIAEPYTVKIGQRILLRPKYVAETAENKTVVVDTAVPMTPKPVEPKPSEVKPPEVKPPEVKPPVVHAPVIKPVETASQTPVVTPMESSISKPSTVVPTESTVQNPALPITAKPVVTAGTIHWRWPSEGMVISRFVQGDTSQQGINIGGKSGQPVKASADGTVVYSGAGLVGYGELIIIKHNNEWLSAYAHNRRRLVAEGTRVNAGDVIAEMGRTGTIRDMLHFEIRRNGKPVDPLLFLPKQ